MATAIVDNQDDMDVPMGTPREEEVPAKEADDTLRTLWGPIGPEEGAALHGASMSSCGSTEKEAVGPIFGPVEERENSVPVVTNADLSAIYQSAGVKTGQTTDQLLDEFLAKKRQEALEKKLAEERKASEASKEKEPEDL
eukprot:GHVU01026248.1.p1 GENE.GHVU01026248.1~~GHVU01026248.1.p1  ORF type:complete len:156 (+),score=35.26 GHVU01026248.1:51-470(+)